MVRVKRRLALAATYVLLAVGALAMALPFLWMVATSLKPPAEVMQMPPTWVPSAFQWQNYAAAWRAAPFDRFFANSFLVAGLSTLGVLATSALAAYAFAILRFPGRDLIFAAVVATLAIPGEVTIVPLFLLMRSLGWVDTYLALIVPGLVSAFGIFLLRQAFGGMPREILDAARVDGCGHLRMLLTMVLPLNRPVLATLALFNFVGQWNAYLWPLLVTNSEEMRPVQIGLRYFMNQDLGNAWGPLMAASTLVVLPTLAAFLLAQKHFVQAFTWSGLKG